MKKEDFDEIRAKVANIEKIIKEKKEKEFQEKKVNWVFLRFEKLLKFETKKIWLKMESQKYHMPDGPD